MEENVYFEADGLKIEGLLEKKNGKKGVIVTHPHPLYGGDMHNPVVESILRSYWKADYTTLRFNFRGVGRSQGVHTDGIGEKNDVKSAQTYLADFGLVHIDLAGYSFGAWINALVAAESSCFENLVLISPPVGMIDFKTVSQLPSLKLVVTGSNDDIASAELIEKLLPSWNQSARFEVINGADHFYMGHAGRLESIIDETI